MEVSKRIISLAMSTIMVAAVCFSATSCKSKTSQVKKVSETDPWYNAKRVELDPQFDPELTTLVFPAGPFLCHDKYVMTYEVSYREPEDPSYMNRSSDLMCIFDQDGNLLNKIDVYEIMSKTPSGFDMYLMLECCESEAGVRLYYTDPTGLSTYSCDIDPDTGLQVGTAKKIDIDQLPEKTRNEMKSADCFVNMVFKIEGYEVFSVRNSSGTNTKLLIAEDMKVIHCIDLQKEFGPGEAQFVETITGVGNGAFLFDCYGKSHLWAKVELATGIVTKLQEGKPVPSDQYFSTTPDGKGYLTKATGIYEYEHETGEEILKLSFDNCDVNRYESQYTRVLSLDENRVIIGGSSRILEFYSLPEPAFVYTLEKADTNPNAGKTVVTVASLSDSLTHFEAEALRTFNVENQGYHAQLVLYDKGNYASESDIDFDYDSTDRQRYSAMAMVSGSLISDIRSGMGPDIVLGAAQSVDLLDSTYLMDLSPYLKSKEYDPSLYYSNIIDASKIDGKTYFIPTAFTVAGILTDGSKLNDGQKGFTYDQYASFVKEQLNGTEPVTEKVSQMHFMSMCVQRNYTDWLNNKKMDFNQEGFRELAGFFKENVPQGRRGVPDEEKLWSIDVYEIPKPKGAIFLEDIKDLAKLARNNFFGSDLKIMGLPSADGAGPSANITNSFSITEGTPVKEGAYAFLDVLLREDVQKNSGEAIPVNRAAVLSILEEEKEQNQIGYKSLKSTPQELLGMLLPDALRQSALYDPKTKLDEIFLAMLENVDSVMIPDNSVLMIVSEEVPPYLLGQKDIDSVISVINSRTQLVYKER